MYSKKITNLSTRQDAVLLLKLLTCLVFVGSGVACSQTLFVILEIVCVQALPPRKKAKGVGVGKQRKAC